MRKKWVMVVMLFITVFLAGCRGAEEHQPVILLDTSAEQMVVPLAAARASLVGDHAPVSRGLAAKMLALGVYDPNIINGLERVIHFTDTNVNQWYDRYINAVYYAGLMRGSDGLFMPHEPLTLYQAQVLLENLGGPGAARIELTDANRNNPVSYALWVDLYITALEGRSGGRGIRDAFGIEERQVIILATPGNNRQLPEWNLITDMGPLQFTGMYMDPYIDKEIRILQKGTEIVAILKVESETPTIRNAYVVRTDPGNSITVFSGGAERTYAYPTPAGAAGRIADVTIDSGRALNVVFSDERVRGTVKQIDWQQVDLGTGGIFRIGESFKVYDITGPEVRWRRMSDLIVGTQLAEFVIKDGRAAAAVITERPAADTLRVALHTTGFQGLLHTNVSVMGTAVLNVTDVAGNLLRSVEPGVVLNITNDIFSGNRIRISTADHGTIQIPSISRNWPGGESPRYRGIIEVAKTAHGFIIINEISMEEYLFSVVPSEIPSAFGVEASMVQAVTARSYAHNQFFANRFHRYGAQIDDSVSSQVYNNLPENDVSIQAVQSTRGQVLSFNGQIITANFFSTSSGSTANRGEVWAHGVTRQFPTYTPSYLRAVKQYSGADFGDLSLEENASRFFRATNVVAPDSHFPWFRWTVELTPQEIAASINANAARRFERNPLLIKTLQPDGMFRSTGIDSIGDLVSLQIMRRGQGGNIMELKAVGTQNTILILTEYNVRALLSPARPVRRHDGTEVGNLNLLPSAFFTLDEVRNENGAVISYRFYGGGNGHGVGMSQNGVRGLLDAGYDFVGVLRHFYPGTEVVSMFR